MRTRDGIEIWDLETSKKLATIGVEDRFFAIWSKVGLFTTLFVIWCWVWNKCSTRNQKQFTVAGMRWRKFLGWGISIIGAALIGFAIVIMLLSSQLPAIVDELVFSAIVLLAGLQATLLGFAWVFSRSNIESQVPSE